MRCNKTIAIAMTTSLVKIREYTYIYQCTRGFAMNQIPKQMKWLALASALAAGLLFMENSYAVGNGFYVGGLLGHSSMDYTASNQHFTPGKTEDNSGFGWNAQAGYQVARNLALQADFYDYGDAHFKNLQGVQGASANYNQKAGDVVAKLVLPLGAFNLNANAGLAYVALDRNANGVAKAHSMNPGDKDVTKFTYGLGAGYDLSPNLTAIVNWQQIPSGGGIQQSNIIAGGLDYYFN